LEEYRACYETRDHYDSVEWTIGSIFIAGALMEGGFVLVVRVTNRNVARGVQISFKSKDKWCAIVLTRNRVE